MTKGILFSLKKVKAKMDAAEDVLLLQEDLWSAFYVNFYPGELMQFRRTTVWRKELLTGQCIWRKKRKPTMKQIWCEIEERTGELPSR